MTCCGRLNKKRIFVLLFDQTKEKYAYLIGCKLGFQKVPVGRINRLAIQRTLTDTFF